MWDFQPVNIIGTLKHRGDVVRIKKVTGSRYGCGWVKTRRQRGINAKQGKLVSFSELVLKVEGA